jgi:two-component system sensor histidine kinase HydH
MSSVMPATHSPQASAQRIEELGRIIMAYSEVTERLQRSHDQLKDQVEHLRVELGEKNRLLERRNRLAALGEMAAGMAHEIRNPLGGIQLYASLLAKDVGNLPQAGELVRKISGGVKRLESLVSQVLNFTREVRVNVQPIDLAEIVEQSIELTQSRRANGSAVHISGPRPMRVTADPVLLGQAILNLALNGIEATDGRGELHVTYASPPEGSDAKQFHLQVRDTGPGIAPETIERIFNPFFTTKETGTGLGLAIVHRIVEAHDGSITASNCTDELGTGAEFEIRI